MIRDMTAAERNAYDLGIRAAIDAARITALTIECADDASTFRKRVTVEALFAFAEAAEGLKLTNQSDAAPSIK